MKSFCAIVKKKIYKFDKKIFVEPDKSLSHRGMILASQCIGVSHLKNVLESDDLRCTIKSLRNLGVKILRKNKGEYLVFGNGLNSFKKTAKKKLFFGNSGTTCLLLGVLATNSNFSVKITGDRSLSRRSMKKFIEPLSKIGCNFKFLNKNKLTLPLIIKGTDFPLAQHHILNSGSAQEKSVILMAGLDTAGITTIAEKKPSRNHTEILLQKIGADIKIKKIGKHKLISLRGQKNLNNFNFSICGDISNAAFFIALTLLTKGSKLTIKNVNLNPFRIGFIRILKKHKGNIKIKNVKKKFGELVGDIFVRSSKLKPIKFPSYEFSSTLDEMPILFILASQIKGVSTFSNIQALREKESDRIENIENGLNKIGIKTKSTKNSLKIFGDPSVKMKKALEIHPKNDHRIAMSFAILGLLLGKKIKIRNFETVNTSFPGFLKLIRKVGGKVEII